MVLKQTLFLLVVFVFLWAGFRCPVYADWDEEFIVPSKPVQKTQTTLQKGKHQDTVPSTKFSSSAAPGAPYIGAAVASGTGQATVSFTAPDSDGGSAIIGYLVTSIPGGKTAMGTTSPITVTGLTTGTAYSFTVQAINAAGTGPASAASSSVKPKAKSPEFVYQEDFEKNPNWSTTSPANLYWESAKGVYYTHVQGDGGFYYGLSPVFPIVYLSSFVIEFDVNPVITGWGTYPRLIFKHGNESNDINAGASKWDIRFEVHWDDHNYNKFILVISNNGKMDVLPFSPTFQTNSWYHNVINFNIDTSILEWTVTNRDSRKLFHYVSKEKVTIGEFNQIVAGNHSKEPYYGKNHWATTLFDNLTISKLSEN